MAAFLPDSLVQAEVMDSSDVGEDCSGEDGALKNCTDVINGDVSNEKMEVDDEDVSAKEEFSSSKDGMEEVGVDENATANDGENIAETKECRSPDTPAEAVTEEPIVNGCELADLDKEAGSCTAVDQPDTMKDCGKTAEGDPTEARDSNENGSIADNGDNSHKEEGGTARSQTAEVSESVSSENGDLPKHKVPISDSEPQKTEEDTPEPLEEKTPSEKPDDVQREDSEKTEQCGKDSHSESTVNECEISPEKPDKTESVTDVKADVPSSEIAPSPSSPRQHESSPSGNNDVIKPNPDSESVDNVEKFEGDASEGSELPEADKTETEPSVCDGSEAKESETSVAKLVDTEASVEKVTPSKLNDSAVSVSSDSSEKPQGSPGKSTARKSVPNSGKKTKLFKSTARKTGPPQSTLVNSGGKKSEHDVIKIFNLHPNSNITLKLSELEKVLNCSKVKDASKTNHSASCESAVKKETSVDSKVSETHFRVSPNPDSVTTDSSLVQNTLDSVSGAQPGFKVQHKRRRKKGGTYDFPGGKKHPKKKKGMLAPSASVETKEEDVSDGYYPLKRFTKKLGGSPRKQYTVMELFKNRTLHKRHTTHEALMRRKSPEVPCNRKTVSQILNERRKDGKQNTSVGANMFSAQGNIGTQASDIYSDECPYAREQTPGSNPEEGKKRMVQKLFITKDGLVSSVNIEDASERENIHQGNSLKRKSSGGGPLVSVGSPDGSVSKKPKLEEGSDSQQAVQQQPMVMVVAQHSQNAPGLRSILPKPHMATAIAVTASSSTVAASPAPVMVSAGQKLLLAAPPLLVKPGTKVALVPVSGKSTFSLVPASVVPVSKGGGNLKGGTSLPKVLSFRPNLSPSSSKNSDALRALLASSGSHQLKTVSMIPGSIPAVQRVSVPSSVVAAISAAQSRVITTMASMSSSASSSSLSSSSSSTSSLSSSVLCSRADGKVLSSIPNGLLPVTPPKTPEGEMTAEGMATTPDSDAIPLCCCKIYGTFFTKLSSGATYCQALDSVDGKALGCCNKVSNLQLVRPGVKIPFMAVCEVHRKRMKMHQCCPGCGHFCTQGKFYQCRKEGSSVHHFHRQCQTERDGRLYCPHCGEESGQVEVTLALNDQQPPQTSEQIRANLRKSISKARMTPCSVGKKKATETQTGGVSVTLPNTKTVSSDGLPVGPDRDGLEKLMNLCRNKAERPKKYRVLPKNMYGPAAEGDMDKVFYMLMDGMDPNQTCEEEDNQTVLHAAVYSGNLALVYLLLQAGACLHTPDKTLKTPLMCAAEYGHLAVLQLLCKAGARLDDRGEDHMTCLHYGAKAGHLEIIRYILDIEAIDVNATDEGGWTPMMWATESQLVDVVKFLVSRGGDPNKKDNEENNALHWAAFAGSVEIAELFLDLGCELDTPNEHGDRPLHIAARQDHYQVVVILLARGANVELKNNKDETPVSCCTNPNSQVCMALKVNKQLRSFAAKLSRPEKLVHRDVSFGRERNPIGCVNAVDDDPHPTDYLYVNHNVETQDLHINNVITSLQSCRCKDDCSSVFCVCSRSSIKCWFDKFGRLIEDFNLLDPPLIFECNRACRCWVNCNNRVVQNGITVRMQVFRTKGRGWGVRSLTDIPKGTFICEYIGEMISDQEADRREDDSYLFDLDNKDGDTYCIDARKYGNVARFINHLCEPNLVPVKVFVEHQDLRFPRICFFSSRDIKPYEEFGFDYGEKFWIIKWKQFTCACGSPKCKYSTETIHRTLEEYRQRHEEEEVAQEGS